MPARRRDDVDEPPQERDRFEHQVRAAVGPWPLELVRDAAVIHPRQSVLRERGPRAVSTQPLERFAVVIGDHDAGVQRETLAPCAQALGAAHGRLRVRR